MNDKEKELYDFLESDKVRGYFQEFFDNQTNAIICQIEEQAMKNQNNEINELDRKYDNEKAARIKEEEKVREMEEEIARRNEERKGLEKKVISLEQLIEKKEKEKESLKEDNQKLNCQIEEINKIKDKELCEMNEKANQIKVLFDAYEKQYKIIDDAYSKYKLLSSDSKNRLRNIFENDSIYGFVSSCSDWRNVEGVWEFAKRRIVEKENLDVENLVYLFEFLLNAYNLQGKEKKYELINPATGEKFDSDKHSIIGVQTDGFVARVRLPGIRDINNGKVIQKALVEI